LEAVTEELEKQVLEGVSRSFYLTLRLLPVPMRGAASLGYLLARTSDTLADTAALPQEVRLKWLAAFSQAVATKSDAPRWPLSLLNAIPDRREKHLLEASAGIFQWLHRLPDAEAELVREVVAVIISGQVLDLERFSAASRAHPVALENDAALEDYAWRVAGCVGAFWTKLGFLTLGGGFSKVDPDVLLARGVSYGKGLQLVNILRDVVADLADGRCYLPVAQPQDTAELLDCHARWRERAETWIGEGEHYAATLRSRRLRAATVLPAFIARKTLEPMRGADWMRLRQRIKVPRSAVYLALLRAFLLPCKAS
jgi:farnesyl-diphosphate farnesyltransferase